MMFLKELQVNEEVRVKKPGKVRRIADGIGPSDFAGLRLNHNQLGLSMANTKWTAKNAEMPKWSFWPVWKK